jgi:hypothetical protein
MTAKEYIYRMLDSYTFDARSKYPLITASDVQIETCMIAFAQEKVKEALETASKKATIDAYYEPEEYNELKEEDLEEEASYKLPYLCSGKVLFLNKDSILSAYSIENIK